jgi:site-specific recombinase XerD
VDFEPFLAHWQTLKQCSPSTITSYRSDLKMFKRFLDEAGITRISQVDHAVINKYIEHMQRQNNPRFGRTGLAESSISRRLAAVSSYFDYVRATSNSKLRNPLDDLTRRWKQNKQPKPVDDLTIEKLLDGITVPRDRMLIGLFLASGLRVSEMHSLDRDTITFVLEEDPTGRERVTGEGIVVGKGRKQRTFYIDEQTLELYAQYLASRKDDHPALFLSERKQRMSVPAIQYTLRAWCKRVGIPHINVHRLRHTYATSLANANISSMVLKDLMGHSSLSTTSRYYKLNDTTLARAYHSAMEYRRQ